MKQTNTTAKSIFLNALLASAGLFLFGFGTYLTIQANLGVGPWDALNLGLSKTFGVIYGTASISVSLIILVIDILLKEKIGIGMFLDAFIVGKTVDLFNATGLVPVSGSLPVSLSLILAGLIIMGFSQFVYMKAALGCGPRDSLLVGLSRRAAKVPIGAVSICMLAAATALGWALGGPIGIGTVLCAGLTGVIMQIEFRLLKFVPTDVTHQTLTESARVIAGRK